MIEFFALREKMYAYTKIDKKVKEKRCKGTKNCVVAEDLAFDDYKTCLFYGKIINRDQMLFQNKNHEVYTINKHKIALNSDYDGIFVQADGILTFDQGKCSAFGLVTIKDVFQS